MMEIAVGEEVEAGKDVEYGVNRVKREQEILGDYQTNRIFLPCTPSKQAW